MRGRHRERPRGAPGGAWDAHPDEGTYMTHTLTELVAGTTPTVIDETRAFWEGTLREELLVQVCNRCENIQLPGGPCCASCWSQDLSWRKASGRGNVYSFTIVRHPFHPNF